MCLAIPAKIIECTGDEALVEIDGIRRKAVIALVDRPVPGDYVLLHAGFAITKWTPKEYEEYRQIMSEIQATLVPAGAIPS